METAHGTNEPGKLKFGKRPVILHRRMKRPLTEKLLVRFPRLASALGTVGGNGFAPEARREPGRLAALMKASGSIDYAGKDKNSFQFYIRPMC